MKGEERREQILKHLSDANAPVSASSMAKLYGVSRQIIVSDIARLRAMGVSISSLSRGYVLDKKPKCERVLKIIHSNKDIEKELNLILELGGSVSDVFVYHKFYGIVSAKMDINSKRDIKTFIENITTGKSTPLNNITSGYHYHTITAESEKTLDHIEQKLKDEGFLAPLQQYEPKEINTGK